MFSHDQRSSQSNDIHSGCRVLLPVSLTSDKSENIGLFNAQSVGNKSLSIATWVTDEKLSLGAIVETWHDGFDSPSLIDCAPES